MEKRYFETNMALKTLAFVAVALATSGLSPRARAQEVVREGTATIGETREGTKVEMSDSEVAELKQWIQNAKYALEQLQENFRLMSLDEKLSVTRSEFNRIVNESGAKANELYVRYILNRALLVSDIVGPNPGAQEKEGLLGLYVESIELAEKSYVDDAAYLDAIGKGVAPSKDLKHIAVFGVEYADRLLAYSQTFLDPRVEYKLTRTALGLLGNDLNSARNLNRTLFTPEIIKIQQLLKIFPQEPKSDTRAVMQDIRKMKYEYRETLKPRLTNKISSSLQIAMATTARPRTPVARHAPEVIESSGGGSIYTSRSYNACYRYLSKDDSGAASSDKCADVAKWFHFDDNSEFEACFTYEYASLNAMDSLNKCVDYIGVKKWRFETENFKTCYAYLAKDEIGSRSADKCADVARWFTFKDNQDFNVCFNHHYASWNAINSLDKCVKDLSSH
jgi:hypothetical protein